MKLPMHFVPYAESLHINLLTDDIRFLEKMVSRAPQDDRRPILNSYLQLWVEVLRENPGPGGNNAGRHAANCWLRSLLDEQE